MKLLYILLMMAGTAMGQVTVQITGQVLDGNGNPYQQGSGRAVLISGNGSSQQAWTTGTYNPVQTPIVISDLDSFGRFSVALTSTALIDQQSAQPVWQLSFKAAAACQPQVSFVMTAMALTSNQDISTQIRAQAASLPPNCAPTSTNAQTLEGHTWEAPGTIGSTTPNTGAFTNTTVRSLDAVYMAGPGATPTIDTAIAACVSVSCTTVYISPTYSGAESASVTTLSNGYKVYVGSADFNVVDLRNQQGSAGAPGNTPLYPVLYRGRLAGQLTGIGINYYNAGAIPDSTAAITGFNWLNNSTLPVNNGAQIGGAFVTEVTGSLTIGASTSVIAAVDGESYLDNTSTDGTLAAVFGVYGVSGISRANSVQHITNASGLRAGTVINASSSGGTIQDAYGLDAFNQNAGTRRNYSIHTGGSWLMERNFGIDLVLADDSTHHLLQALSSDSSVNISGFDATGGVHVKKSNTTTDALVINDTNSTFNQPLRVTGDITPATDGGGFAGNSSFHWAGLYLKRCTSAASPAVCSSAATGSVNLAASATAIVVNTTLVSANSTIHVTRDNSLGAALSVTCNTQSSLTLGTPYVSARTAATSFTITVDVAPTTNPLCLSYTIVN